MRGCFPVPFKLPFDQIHDRNACTKQAKDSRLLPAAGCQAQDILTCDVNKSARGEHASQRLRQERHFTCCVLAEKGNIQIEPRDRVSASLFDHAFPMLLIGLCCLVIHRGSPYESESS